MTDREPSFARNEELERQLSDHYRTMPHDADSTLTSRVGAALDRAPEPGRGPSLWRLALTTAAAVVLVAVLIVPRFMPAVGPGSSAGPAGPAGPTFNLPAALNAQIDMVGQMRSGGLWVAQGSYLLTSTDNGDTWNAGQLPTPYLAIYVLDSTHAWTIGAVHDPSGLVAPSIPASGLVVHRTADGGRTWQQAGIPGQLCQLADLAFVDATRGFLICLGATTTQAGAPASGSDAVFRTDDGGAAWSVAASASGLGLVLAVSDSDTLWSAPDFRTSQQTGVWLQVSRDAGVTWSRVALPEAETLSPAGSGVVTAGPDFWDASNGALAVDVYRWGQSSAPPEVWFYRTSDGGRAWTLSKVQTQMPAMVGGDALVGKQWAVVGQWANAGRGNAGALAQEDLSVSTDFGATWTNVAGSGMPPNVMWSWLAFSDKDHGAGMVFSGAPMVQVLLLTSDGGRTWHPASFGDARAHVQPDSTLDAAAATKVASDFETFAVKDPGNAWNRLSSYSQRQFGSEAAFESAEAALAKRTNYSLDVGAATRRADVLNSLSVGASLWNDVSTFADMSRACLVVVTFPGTSEPPQKLVVAPLSATGEWRVWLATSG